MKRHVRWLVACAILLVAALLAVGFLPRRADSRGPLIRFWGAARRVGGSCLLVEDAGARFIVDCGALGEEGVGALPPRPDSLDFVILTHAHIDHCGLIPALFAAGFTGRVYCTSATAELAPIMFAMERGISAAAIGRETMDRAVASLVAVPFGERVREGPVSFRLMRAEHLLGAAWVDLWLSAGTDSVRLVVSGDLGSGNSVLLPPLERPARADYVVMESTYGASSRETAGGAAGDSHESFGAALGAALGGGGDALVPAFTLGRTQEAMAVVDMFIRRGAIPPETEVFVDSPTARKITGVYRAHKADLSARAREAYPGEALRFPTLREVRSRTSLAVHARRHLPAIFITSSGDLAHANAPRHLMRMYADPRNLLCIIGWQAPGSPGARLAAGETPVPVRHQEGKETREDWISPRLAVKSFRSFSAHADARGLMAWLRGARGAQRVFLVHGEESQALPLAESIRATLGLAVSVPKRGDGFVLTPRDGAVPAAPERRPPAPGAGRERKSAAADTAIRAASDTAGSSPEAPGESVDEGDD